MFLLGVHKITVVTVCIKEIYPCHVIWRHLSAHNRNFNCILNGWKTCEQYKEQSCREMTENNVTTIIFSAIKWQKKKKMHLLHPFTYRQQFLLCSFRFLVYAISHSKTDLKGPFNENIRLQDALPLYLGYSILRQCRNVL